MEHSIALVTGTTSGLGYAAASMLATKGYREVLVTGRSLGRVKETAAQLAAENKTVTYTPLELDLDKPSSVQSAVAELVKQGKPIAEGHRRPRRSGEGRVRHLRSALR